MRKVDEWTINRIIELKTKYGLTNDIIGIRLGLSPRTVRVYLRAHRTATIPYRPHVPRESRQETPRQAD